MNKVDFEVIIIGGGVAGISAALWCHELGLQSVLLESKGELGGQLLRTYNAIENYLGIEAKNGKELRDVFVDQLSKRKFELRLNTRVVDVDLNEKKVVLSNGDVFRSNALIIATGVSRRKLGVEGELEFTDKGILVSGKRDKDLVKGKTVLIVGGGDAAFENVEILSETAPKIILVHRRQEFSARREFIDMALANPKVEIKRNTIVKKIDGGEIVERVWLQNSAESGSTSIEIGAVLVRIGVQPNTDFLLDKIALDANNYILVNQNCETNMPSVFAVGDVANPNSPTISSAVGMANTAVKSYLSKSNLK